MSRPSICGALPLKAGALFLVVYSLLWYPAAGQPAEGPAMPPGTLAGRVYDAGNAQPLPQANILITGTPLGTISQPDGSFVIERVPPGQYAVVVTYIGYETEERVATIVSGETTHLDYGLTQTVAALLDPLEIHAERPVIDVTKTSTAHTLSATQLPTIDDVVAQQPGVVKDRGRLHFRGGRSDESLFVVDGVKVKDLLSGESMGSEVASRSAQEVNIMTGGFGARYSQAMSGVVETRIKEGTQRWHGALSYETDALFGSQNLHHFC
jgi:hypothetical protein